MNTEIIKIEVGKTYLVEIKGRTLTLIQKMQVREITKTCYGVIWLDRHTTEYILKTKLGIACQITPESGNCYIIEELEDSNNLSMTAIDAIIQERKEQLVKHKRSVIRDMQENPNGELIKGAAALLLRESNSMPSHWDPDGWLHLLNKPEKERLVVAASLIVAQLDVIEAQEPLKRI